MGVMAVRAEEIGPLPGSGKITRSFPVDARFPIPVDVAVTFSAEPVTLIEVDELSVEELQLIPILGIVAIKAPPHRLRMMEVYLCMLILQFPLFSIHFHRGVTVAARIDPFGERRRRDGKLPVRAPGQGGKEKLRQE